MPAPLRNQNAAKATKMTHAPLKNHKRVKLKAGPTITFKDYGDKEKYESGAEVMKPHLTVSRRSRSK